MNTLQGLFTVDTTQLSNMLVAIPLLPLLGAIVNGFFGRRIGNANAVWVGFFSIVSIEVILRLTMECGRVWEIRF